MRVEDIKLLYQYNEWANRRILAAAEQLSAEQLSQPNGLGWGDMRGLLVHILNAEIGWRHRLGNQGEYTWLEAEDFADIAAIRARYDAETAHLWQYLNGLSDAEVNAVLTYERAGETRSSALWHFLVHVVNHGTQHRSECAALLTGFGYSPGDMDFTVFLHSRPQGG